MMNQQLYVDGVLMDITEDMSILLDIKSNLFRDVTNITANNTYTINLPKTAHNMAVLEHSDKPKSLTKFPYKFHVCRYFRNGVEIIKDGRLTLMSVADSIEVAIYWGIFPAFTKLQEDGLKLNELKTDERLLFTETNKTADRQTATEQGVFYADYISEQFDDSEEEAWQGGYNDITKDGVITDKHVSDLYWYMKTYYRQPCVTCRWLLNLIASQAGVNFVFPSSESEYIRDLVIPIINNKADDKTITGKVDATFISRTDVGALSFVLNDIIDSFSEVKGTTANILNVSKDCTLSFNVQMKYSWNVEYGGWGVSEGVENNSKQVFPYYIEMAIEHYAVSGDGGTDTYIIGNAFDSDGKRKSYLVYQLEAVNNRCYRLITGSGKIELKKFDKITFTLKNEGGTLHDTKMYDAFFTICINVGDEVPVGGMFPIGINLPEISILDFIRTLSLITGTFARQISDSGKVEFVYISSIWGNRDKAVDWSSRLIPLEARNTPRKSEYVISDYCQHNHYKWQEDDETKGDYDADFEVSNNTLEYEQDSWTIPFAATDGNRIPIRSKYSKTGETEKGGEYKGCKPRIVNLASNLDKATLSFDIDLQNIFATKYDQLAKSLSRAHVITEHLYLSDLEIMNFDETIPVYLAQYGAYFAVLELKVTDSGYTEATMIQLEF